MDFIFDFKQICALIVQNSFSFWSLMRTIKCAVEQILDSWGRNPRDSRLPRSLSLSFSFFFFKRRCAVIPSRAPQRWWTLPLRQISDFCSLFTITETIKPKVTLQRLSKFRSCILQKIKVRFASLVRSAEDGSPERVARSAFTGLCDHLQSRTWSRRGFSLQQPLRRVSKDPLHSFRVLSRPRACTVCWESARQRGFLLESP